MSCRGGLYTLSTCDIHATEYVLNKEHPLAKDNQLTLSYNTILGESVVIDEDGIVELKDRANGKWEDILERQLSKCQDEHKHEYNNDAWKHLRSIIEKNSSIFFIDNSLTVFGKLSINGLCGLVKDFDYEDNYSDQFQTLIVKGVMKCSMKPNLNQLYNKYVSYYDEYDWETNYLNPIGIYSTQIYVTGTMEMENYRIESSYLNIVEGGKFIDSGSRIEAEFIENNGNCKFSDTTIIGQITNKCALDLSQCSNENFYDSESDEPLCQIIQESGKLYLPMTLDTSKKSDLIYEATGGTIHYAPFELSVENGVLTFKERTISASNFNGEIGSVEFKPYDETMALPLDKLSETIDSMKLPVSYISLPTDFISSTISAPTVLNCSLRLASGYKLNVNSSLIIHGSLEGQGTIIIGDKGSISVRGKTIGISIINAGKFTFSDLLKPKEVGRESVAINISEKWMMYIDSLPEELEEASEEY